LQERTVVRRGRNHGISVGRRLLGLDIIVVVNEVPQSAQLVGVELEQVIVSDGERNPMRVRGSWGRVAAAKSIIILVIVIFVVVGVPARSGQRPRRREREAVERLRRE